ncbi:MAG: hypothetical protein OEZ59_13005 [Deltaproteobacteria bacterium]|nr:hypothetical protein [Deltaproteobacteria bacterium]
MESRTKTTKHNKSEQGRHHHADERLEARAVLEHGIKAQQIHPNVLFICHRLVEQGYTALIVGGAVRDLLLGRSPKDFDLVTSARPEKVKTMFRNARLIGRRFKLAELRFPSMSVEVATFRSEPQVSSNGMIKRDNRYGTPEEDAFRRDFTINALSFDPLTLELFDYVGGLQDVRSGRVRTIKPPGESIQEDPVRMLRAVRFKMRLGFQMDSLLEKEIRANVRLLGNVTRHRLAEETQRFLTRANAEPMYGEFARLGLLKPLLHMKSQPWFFSQEAQRDPLPVLGPLLKRMDEWLGSGRETPPATVAQLALLLTLSEPGVWKALFPGAGGKKGAAPSANFWQKLSGFLSDWGMLNGQVEPAVRILKAAEMLQRAGCGDAAARGDAAPGDDTPGIREGWLLLAMLKEPLRIDGGYLEAGLSRLDELPDLPILDHPRPQGRTKSRKKRRPSGRQRGRDRNRKPSAEELSPDF